MLPPGSPIYEEIFLQYYNDEEADESFKYSEILQLTFGSMTAAQIEKEYCGGVPVMRLLKLEDVVKERGIPNVFDQEGKDRSVKDLTSADALEKFGVKELIGKL